MMIRGKTCEKCGQKKPLSEFSKSYKNRCKECVAEMQRSKRAEKSSLNNNAHSVNDKPIDWEQRRASAGYEEACKCKVKSWSNK